MLGGEVGDRDEQISISKFRVDDGVDFLALLLM